MLGAIIGDIVGSRFEWHNLKSKTFDLFTDQCRPTDDSIMTVAVAQALLGCGGDYTGLGTKAVAAMREIGRLYPNCGYGGRFLAWLYSEAPRPYRSYGNGAAMRVAPCGFAAHSLGEAKALARAVTEVTHDHPEGLKGAEATAVAIWLARSGQSIPAIRAHIRRDYYPLDLTLDAIRNAVSLGGDSDTIAAITGGIAEAYYGIPEDIARQACGYLDARCLGIVRQWEQAFGKRP